MMVNDTHPPFLREGVVGKELEILKEIALWNKKKRCTQYRLRQSSQHWGIETIKKQIHRLDREGCIEKEKNGYTVTDRGLFTLLEYVVSPDLGRKLVKIAAERFPDGETMLVYSRYYLKLRGTDNELLLQSLRIWFQTIETNLIKRTLRHNSRYAFEILTDKDGKPAITKKSLGESLENSS